MGHMYVRIRPRVSKKNLTIFGLKIKLWKKTNFLALRLLPEPTYTTPRRPVILVSVVIIRRLVSVAATTCCSEPIASCFWSFIRDSNFVRVFFYNRLTILFDDTRTDRFQAHRVWSHSRLIYYWRSTKSFISTVRGRSKTPNGCRVR